MSTDLTRFILFSQAITDQKLSVRTLPLLCQELQKHWKDVVEFLKGSLPSQEMQGSRRHAQSLEWVLIHDEFFLCRLEFFSKIVRDC